MWITRSHRISNPFFKNHRLVRQRYEHLVKQGVFPTMQEMNEWVETNCEGEKDNPANFSIHVPVALVEQSQVQDSMDSYYDEMKPDEKEVHAIGTRTHSLNKCVICLARRRTKIKIVPCGCTFHRRCIDQWLKWKLNCPICDIPVTTV